MFKTNGRVNKSFANKTKSTHKDRTFICKSCGAHKDFEIEFGEAVVCENCGSQMVEKKLEK